MRRTDAHLPPAADPRPAECLAGLTLDPVQPPCKVARSTLHTYLAPEQETKLADGDACTRCDTAAPLGVL